MCELFRTAPAALAQEGEGGFGFGRCTGGYRNGSKGLNGENGLNFRQHISHNLVIGLTGNCSR